jgi:hypothetical protein
MYPGLTPRTNIPPGAAQVCKTYLAIVTAVDTSSYSNLDHGLAYGWSQTTHRVPIISKVHPENFTVRGWGILHHAGYLSYPHHDAEGTLTWLRMEHGVKFWVVFRPKNNRDDRKHLQEFVTRLVDFTNHEEWVRKHCDAEVIVLRPGNIVLVIHLFYSTFLIQPFLRIMPPGTVHAVYTPVPSFATGGHFYHYMCLHLTELARYIDSEAADSTTNQDLEHALETLRRMMIMVPYLSLHTGKHMSLAVTICIFTPVQCCTSDRCWVSASW